MRYLKIIILFIHTRIFMQLNNFNNLPGTGKICSCRLISNFIHSFSRWICRLQSAVKDCTLQRQVWVHFCGSGVCFWLFHHRMPSQTALLMPFFFPSHNAAKQSWMNCRFWMHKNGFTCSQSCLYFLSEAQALNANYRCFICTVICSQEFNCPNSLNFFLLPDCN